MAQSRATGKRQPQSRWLRDELLFMAAQCVPLIDKGLDAIDALYKVQREFLPPFRQKVRAEVSRTVFHGTFRRYMTEIRDMTQAQRDALTLPDDRHYAKLPSWDGRIARTNPRDVLPPPPPAFKPELARYHLIERDYAGNGKWTRKERALIARQVEHWRKCGDARNVAHLIIDAQELVLPIDRRRAHGGIKKGNDRGKNEAWIAEALNDIWQIKAVPFDHTAQAPSLGGGKLPGFAEQVETPTPAPAPTVADAPPAAKEARQSAEGTPPDPAPLPAPLAPPGGVIERAARVFTDTMTQALAALLHTQANYLMGQVQLSSAEQARVTAASVAALVEEGMQRAVHRMVEHELGGPVNPPSAQHATGVAVGPTPSAAPVPDAGMAYANGMAPTIVAPRPAPRVHVDVVGLNKGGQCSEVRNAFAGQHGVDIRFLSSDVSKWRPTPSRHVILLTGWISHGLQDKVKAAGIDPILLHKSPAEVIQAIEELQRAQVAQVAH